MEAELGCVCPHTWALWNVWSDGFGRFVLCCKRSCVLECMDKCVCQDVILAGVTLLMGSYLIKDTYSTQSDNTANTDPPSWCFYSKMACFLEMLNGALADGLCILVEIFFPSHSESNIYFQCNQITGGEEQMSWVDDFTLQMISICKKTKNNRITALTCDFPPEMNGCSADAFIT